MLKFKAQTLRSAKLKSFNWIYMLSTILMNLRFSKYIFFNFHLKSQEEMKSLAFRMLPFVPSHFPPKS